MPKSETLRLINISQFDDSILAPARRLVPLARSDVEDFRYDFAMANMLEAIWWLQLGVDLEYFPEKEAVRLLENLFNSTKLFIIESVEAFFQRLGPHFAMPLIETIKVAYATGNAAAFFEDEGSLFFRSPETLWALFQNFLILTSTFGLDPLVRGFIAVVNFASQQRWIELTETPVSKHELTRVLFRPQTPAADRLTIVSIESLVSGFCKAIDFMSTIEALFQDLALSDEVEREDYFRILRRIGTLQRWRFSVHLNEIAARFEEVALLGYREVIKDLGTTSTEEDQNVYLGRIRGLANEWRLRGESNTGRAG